MTWRVGRTVASSAVTVPGVTGAYAALDAIGSAFFIPMAIGDEGALVAQLLLFDRATAMSGMRVNFFNQVPTVIANNDPFTVVSGMEQSYLGKIDVLSTDWVTAGITGGNTAMFAQITNQNIGIYNNSGSGRGVWAQLQALQALTFGGLASNSALTLRMVTLQD